MNPFYIHKDNRKKKPRKKSSEEDPNLVFKASYDLKMKVSVKSNIILLFLLNQKKKDNEESEESKSNALSLKKPKTEQNFFKSRETPSNEMIQ